MSFVNLPVIKARKKTKTVNDIPMSSLTRVVTERLKDKKKSDLQLTQPDKFNLRS